MTDAGDTIVAWGRVAAAGANQFNDHAAVFVTRDGRTWRSSPIVDGVGSADTAELVGVGTGPGGLIAYGSTCCTVETAALWHSPDGLDWRRIAVRGDIGLADGYLYRVVGGPTGWVALLRPRIGQGSDLWTSVDGISWEPAEADIGLATVSEIALVGHRFVAVGYVDGPDGSHDGAIWRSTDGRAWDRLAADDLSLVGEDEVELWSVTALPDDAMLVEGNVGSSEDRRRCEDLLGMVASADPRPPPPPGDGTSCGWGTQHAWTWTDAEGLERFDVASLPGDRPTGLRAADRGGPNLVVLAEGSGPASPDTGLYATEDGVSWRRIEDGRPMLEANPISLVIDGRRIVAVVDRWDGARTTIEVWIGAAR